MAPGFLSTMGSAEKETAAGPGYPAGKVFRSFQRMVVAAVEGDNLATPLATDIERGMQSEEEHDPQWVSWARSAVCRVRETASQAAEQGLAHAQRGVTQVAERAQTIDWDSQVQNVRGSVSRGLESATTVATVVSGRVSETVGQGVESARSADWAESAKGLQRGVSMGLERVSSNVSTASSMVQDNVSVASSASQRALSAASERASGAVALAREPEKLMRFSGIFMLGIFMIMISLNFLPTLLIKPANFALFFTIGSVTILASFLQLQSFDTLFAQLVDRSKLPFSSAYAVGLIGTLVSTLLIRSYILTAVFALMQAVSLLYLVFSYVPGGTSCLNMLGRFSSRSARSVVLGS